MGTWIAGAVVLAMAGFAVYSLRKDRKRGKGCGGGCGSCSACPKAAEGTSADV